MRIATWNIEWFNSLFARNGTLLDDSEWSARYNVTRSQQTGAIAIVMSALEADVLLVVEAPDRQAGDGGRAPAGRAPPRA